MGDISTTIFIVIAFLVIISFHEAAHAWSAYMLGDSTAKDAGRMTLNPLKHLDPIGTIAILIFHFGWGKPVSSNPNNFKNPTTGYVLTSLAGPASNLVLSALLIIPYKYFLEGATNPYVQGLASLTLITIFYSLVLMIFNLIPLGPLDGAKIWYLILPASQHDLIYQMEKNGLFILIIIFLFSDFFNLNLLGWIGTAAQYLLNILYFAT
jgi:Zn-dependent protease